MNRPKIFKALRIAWSVAWGVVAVLLCVLWVRSYRFNEFLTKLDPGNQVIGIGSANGDFNLARVIDLPTQLGPPQPPRMPHGWKYDGFPPDKVHRSFKWTRDANGFILYVPFWFLVATSAAFGVAPWLPFRFSLRTLLIATTLVAVGLGTIIALSR